MSRSKKKMQKHPNAITLVWAYLTDVGDKSREILANELGISVPTLTRLSKKEEGRGYNILSLEEREVVDKVLRDIIKEGYSTLKKIRDI